MAASSASVPSWNPLAVNPITALTKMVAAEEMTDSTRASLNDDRRRPK